MAKTKAPKVPICREVWSMEFRTGSYLEWCCEGLFEQEADARRWSAAQKKAYPGLEYRVISRIVRTPSYCAAFERPLTRNSDARG
jgi:hypothetical protein